MIHLPLLPAFLLLACPQDPAPAAAAPAPAPALEAVLAANAGLASHRFTARVEEVAALTRAMRRRMAAQMGEPGATEIEGSVCGDLRRFLLHDGDVELVTHQGRSVTRAGGDAWIRTRDTLANGDRAPWLFDLATLCEALQEIPAEARRVTRSETVQDGGRELVRLCLTLEGAHARALGNGGILPRIAQPRFMVMGGSRQAPAEELKLVYDLALTIDPKTLLLHRLRVQAHQESHTPGMMVRFGGPGGEEEDEPEAEEAKKDAGGDPVYTDGLPSRAKDKDVSVVRLDVRVREHGAVKPPALDDRARAILRLPAVK
ncbi:MAG: hypothetical protein IT458_01720 [Planctomycetes bacterium]|nr:hypothetical protein [Planctomycetota bacterium]